MREPGRKRRDLSLCRGFIYVSISIVLKWFFHFGVATLLMRWTVIDSLLLSGRDCASIKLHRPPAGIYGMLRSNWRQRTARAFSQKPIQCPALPRPVVFWAMFP